MGFNEHLLQCSDGDQDAVIELVGFKGHQIGIGGSGYAPGGNYELEVRGFSIVKKKSGKNVRVEMVVAGPSAYIGIPIVSYIAAPVGEPGDSTYDTGNRQLKDFFASVHSGLGTLKEKLEQDRVKINGAWAKGKRLWAVLRDGKQGTEGEGRSEVERFLLKDEYDANSGPQKGSELASETAPKGGRAQREAPEITRGNGAAAPSAAAGKTNAAIDSALGIGVG